ncbi:TfoX N-terminal domain protein [Streptococcus constellatus subsp. pharyngis SK1060 = CCUG 46377]|uniref:TfoX N-terminal domain protein n=1 Tax=Streptococcus constellatus subsp. pharyngis SK1060 = CCUG 46377 TaxID=1035184 RepID=F9P5S1_STRCV|nr:TfoX N-terminal domain protein [Streptococcus constellatus subsp. pharyngis SK1060 = CCUG 46377]
MASSKNYLEFVLEQLSGLDDVTYRSMMGEYILYFRGKIIGGIYDNRFLVKPVQAVLDKIAQPSYEFPYEGAKEMILVEDLENQVFLEDLILAMYDQLPLPKPKRKINGMKQRDGFKSSFLIVLYDLK